MKYDYNPFGKDFDQLTSSDLSALLAVAEGWYVEYKREILNATAIAKSVTAFANTYGGWLFFGVAEKSKDEPVAGSFPGIANSEADGCLQKIRQAVAHQAQPSPFFRVKALSGPVEAIGLEEGRCVIAVQVPWGPEAPYVHKDGRIYRRVGDGSEPRAENDRFVLDQLFKRSDKIVKYHSEWVNRDLETSEREEDAAYARIFLISDFWQDHGPRPVVSLRRVREIMTSAENGPHIPFDNVYQTSGVFVCRQIMGNDPELQGLNWKLHQSFDSEIVIPLVKLHEDHVQQLGTHFNEYEHGRRFLKACAKQGYEAPTVIDLNLLLHVLLGLTHIQSKLAKEFDWHGSIFAKIELSGIWRTIPFFDTENVIEEYEKHGIALSLRDKLTIYPGDGRDSYLELYGREDATDDESFADVMAIILFNTIASALGVSLGTDPDGDGTDTGDAIGKFLAAGRRAIHVQTKRSKRRPDEE